MDTMIVAKVLGVYFMVSGIFVVTHKKTLAKLLKDLFDHRAVTFIIGLILLLGGAALILAGGDNTPFIITLISWAILLKGLAYIFAPEWMHGVVRSINVKSYSLMGVLTAAIGVYLFFFF